MSHNLRILSQQLSMIEQRSLLLAIPIAKVILGKFYEGVGTNSLSIEIALVKNSNTPLIQK
jgi:hypothetical protein